METKYYHRIGDPTDRRKCEAGKWYRRVDKKWEFLQPEDIATPLTEEEESLLPKAIIFYNRQASFWQVRMLLNTKREFVESVIEHLD